jgi:hypothetical protein
VVRVKQPTGGYRVHVVDTEAQTLDDALELIRLAQARRHRRQAHLGKKSPAQEMAWARGRAHFQKYRGQISLGGSAGHNRSGRPPAREKKPDPFKSLPEDEKHLRAISMYQSKDWGEGVTAGRRLARCLGVPIEKMGVWLGMEITRNSTKSDDKIREENKLMVLSLFKRPMPYEKFRDIVAEKTYFSKNRAGVQISLLLREGRLKYEDGIITKGEK